MMRAVTLIMCTQRLTICSKLFHRKHIYNCASSSHASSSSVLYPVQVQTNVSSSKFVSYTCNTSSRKHSSYAASQGKYAPRNNTEKVNPNSVHKSGKAFVKDVIQHQKGIIDEICDSIDITVTEFDESYWQRTIVDKLANHHRLVKFWPTLIVNALAHRHPCCVQYVAMGESIMKYHTTPGVTNVGLLVSFALLCARHGGPAMHSRVFQIYEDIMRVTDVLDSTSAGLLIEAFSLTSRWRHCFELLQMAALSCEPSVAMYSAIAVAALKAGDMKIANDMLMRMRTSNFVAEDRVFLAMIEQDNGSGELVREMLECLAKYGWIPSENVALKCKDWFDKRDVQNWRTEFTDVDNRGVCRVCRNQLMPLRNITRKEFQVLQAAFLEKSLLKDDVFQNTSPSEVKKFQDFIRANAPFDVVLDALNLYHATFRKANFQFRMNLIKSVIDYFVHRYPDKKLLVMGRQHMTKWPQTILRYIESRAVTFYAEDSSADDPFMTYAALYSGRDTLVVTKDELRDHRFLLGWKLADDFKRWQRSHQVVFRQVVTNKQGYRQPLFRWPNRHETAVQSSNHGWHIPYEDNKERASYELPRTWLCVMKRSNKG